jgi:hypothetical protein
MCFNISDTFAVGSWEIGAWQKELNTEQIFNYCNSQQEVVLHD